MNCYLGTEDISVTNPAEARELKEQRAKATENKVKDELKEKAREKIRLPGKAEASPEAPPSGSIFPFSNFGGVWNPNEN